MSLPTHFVGFVISVGILSIASSAASANASSQRHESHGKGTGVIKHPKIDMRQPRHMTTKVANSCRECCCVAHAS